MKLERLALLVLEHLAVELGAVRFVDAVAVDAVAIKHSERLS